MNINIKYTERMECKRMYNNRITRINILEYAIRETDVRRKDTKRVITAANIYLCIENIRREA